MKWSASARGKGERNKQDTGVYPILLVYNRKSYSSECEGQHILYSTWNMELSRAHHELTFFLKSSIFYSNVVHEGFGFCAFCAF